MVQKGILDTHEHYILGLVQSKGSPYKSILYFDNVKDIFSYMKSLEKYGGVTAVTIGDRMIVPYLAKAFPGINIQSSGFLHIDTANKVREAWKMGIKSFHDNQIN